VTDGNGDVSSFGPSVEYEEGLEDDDDRMTEEEKMDPEEGA
jgi:hypothetical protein